MRAGSNGKGPGHQHLETCFWWGSKVRPSKKYIENECKKRNLDFISSETNFFYIKFPKKLVHKIDNNFTSIKPGIRAQLLNKETNELVQDFVLEHTKNSTHILNAVSPGFTCSFSFAEYVVDEISNNLEDNLWKMY